MGKRAKDRIGEKHEKLKILDWKRESGKTYFYCRCDCGKEKWMRSDGILNGNTKSCGCQSQFKEKDLKDKRFGRLVAVKKTDKRDKYNGSVIWECLCDCKNVVEVSASNLTRGGVRSCGCLAKEIERNSMEKAMKKRKEAYLVDNTDILCISRENPIKSNTSGITGVRYDKTRKKWVAQIVFQGKAIHLGRYEKKEDAVAARKAAEEKYFKPVLEKYREDGEI